MANTQVNSTSLQLGESQLTTGNDDHLLPKLIHAINHAHEIEITVSFIQRSGLALLFEPLKDALAQNCRLKLLTSDYLDITDPIALRELMPLIDQGADIRIYQSDNKQSFHMKSYIFVKTKEGQIGAELTEGCAFIGSNNISKAALTNAHEWSYRHDFKLPIDSREASTFRAIRNAFNDIFSNQRVTSLTNDWISAYLKRRKTMKFVAVNDLENITEMGEVATPNSVQIDVLNALKETREEGFRRGLVVLATGMGKTWLSAFDVKQIAAKRVLFVAHRDEILIQAQRTFAQLLPEKTTGFYRAKDKDEKAELLFASVQTLGKINHLKRFTKDHFDYVIVDEFHHASAAVYQNLLGHFNPTFLLGLTATPERTDQADILGLCDNNLVFERNLTQGIDEQILVPFHYYGIWDGSVDYAAIPWRNGRFDPTAIDNQFATQKRSQHILTHWKKHKQETTLAFCISTKHADFMAESFVNQGIKAVSVHSQSCIRRNDALNQLANGELDIIFSVDLFNEGTDLPAIDTILMLRPSNSKILFLQQLGRGLRQFANKSHLVVLDFIGNHHSFLNKPAALLGGGTMKEILANSREPNLGDGCFVNYDIEITDFWDQLSTQQRTTASEDYQYLFEILGHRPTASEFHLEYGSLKKVNKQMGSWSEMLSVETENKVLTPYFPFLLEAVQMTTLTKCFKAILLESFLRLDGFTHPPTLKALASDSWLVLNRYPHLIKTELPEKQKNLSADSAAWLTYWKQNPIKAFCNKSKKKGDAWFKVEGDHFIANINVQENDKQALHDQVQELLNYRLLQYSQRSKTDDLGIEKGSKESERADYKVEQLLFYPNLKIACGHFKTGDDSHAEYINSPDGFGSLHKDKHFLARATGNSMNGGKHPIEDGDLLLLELITSESAGSLQGQTVVIENYDVTGDDQYLLRDIKKLGDGQYQLLAKNSDYEPMLSTDEMKPVARLKGIVTSLQSAQV